MAKKTVLAIGIDPSVVDFSALSGLTAELVRNYIDAQIERLRSLGFEAESYLIDLMVSALNGVGSPEGWLCTTRWKSAILLRSLHELRLRAVSGGGSRGL